MKDERGRRYVIGAAWLAVSVGVFGIYLHSTQSTTKILVLLAAFAPYVMLAGLLGLLLSTVAKHRMGVWASVVVVGVAVWTQLPVFVANGAAGAGAQLTAMQSNIRFGHADAHALVAQIRANNVDVLTVSELTDDALANLAAAGIGELLPHSYVVPAPSSAGEGIWSRYPLTEQRSYDGFGNVQLSARMTLPSGEVVTVFAFHPVPPYPDTDRWSVEMREIKSILFGSPESAGAAIVGADLGATHDHALFRSLLETRFEDAADQIGAGMVATYPADQIYPALVGIDHILAAGARADTVETVPIPQSDHLAIVAEVRLRIPRGAP